MNLYTKEADGYRLATSHDVSLWLQDEVAAKAPGQTIVAPIDAAAMFVTAIQASPSEVFAVAYLDNRHRVIRFEIAFRGTIDNTTIYPREIVRRALELNAAAIICGHNHPSGVTEPSDADRLITRRLRDALELVDVRLLDHFVVGLGNACTSLAARGLI